VEDYIRKWW